MRTRHSSSSRSSSSSGRVTAISARRAPVAWTGAKALRAYPSRVVEALDEGELVRRAQAGDRAAVTALLERHLPGLEAYVRLRVGRAFGPRDGVSDVVQSACRDLLERLDGFQHGGEHAFRHWLYATAARKIADRFAFHGAERRNAGREAPPPRPRRPWPRPSPASRARASRPWGRSS